MWPGHDANPPTTEHIGPEPSDNAEGPRLVISTDLENELSKPLRHVYLMFMSTRRLFEEGKVMEAWTRLSSLIGVAEMIGLNQDGTPDEVVEFPRRIWWLLRDFDAQVSLILGRPPRTALHKEIPQPSLEGLTFEEKILRRNTQNFSSLVLEAMKFANSEKTEAHDTYAHTLEEYLLRLHQHQAQLTALQQRTHTTIPLWVAIADHQIEVQLFEIIIHCALVRCLSSAPTTGDKEADKGRNSHSSRDKKVKKIINNLLQSARITSDTFAYIHDIDSGIAVSSWPRCFGLCCAAVILAMPQLRKHAVLDEDVLRVEQALDIFRCRPTNAPKSDIASWEIAILNKLLTHIRLRVSVQEGNIASASHDEGAASSMTRDNSPAKPVESEDGGITTYMSVRERDQSSLKRETISALHDDGPGPRIKKHRRIGEANSTFKGPTKAGVLNFQGLAGSQFTLPMAAAGNVMAMTSNHGLPPQNNLAQPSYKTSPVTPFNIFGQTDYVPMNYTPTNPIEFAALPYTHPFVNPQMRIGGSVQTDGGSPLFSNEQRSTDTSILEQYEVGMANLVPMSSSFPIMPDGFALQNEPFGPNFHQRC